MEVLVEVIEQVVSKNNMFLINMIEQDYEEIFMWKQLWKENHLS